MIVYNKLFDLLARRGMKKTDLLVILSSKTISKLSKCELINTRTILEICNFLDCQPGDIMEYVPSVSDESYKSAYISSGERWNSYQLKTYVRPELVERFRIVAAAHKRSMSMELVFIIEEHIREYEALYGPIAVGGMGGDKI